MKKLGKIKLHDVTVLNDNEMKFIVGGSGVGESGIASCNKKACKTQSDCAGYCADIKSPGIAGCIGLYCM